MPDVAARNIAWRKALVFSGSCPAMILVGFTSISSPTTSSVNWTSFTKKSIFACFSDIALPSYSSAVRRPAPKLVAAWVAVKISCK